MAVEIICINTEIEITFHRNTPHGCGSDTNRIVYSNDVFILYIFFLSTENSTQSILFIFDTYNLTLNVVRSLISFTDDGDDVAREKRIRINYYRRVTSCSAF